MDYSTAELDGYQSRHRDVVEKYVADVVSGRVIVGEKIRQAVERHLVDLQRADREGWVLDWRLVDRAIDFIQCLTLKDGEFEGRPFELQPWQKWVVAMIFGWRFAATGLRRFREVLMIVGRGNGKSPFAAALCLVLGCADFPAEARAEIKIASTQKGDEDNSGARIVFNECTRQIKGNDELKARFDVVDSSAVYKPLGCTIQPLSGKGSTKDGFNLHAFVADELHEWHEEHRKLWEKLNTAMGKRRQPLAITITTAGDDRSVILNKYYNRAANVLAGVYRNDALFAAIYEIDDGDDACSPKVWPKANPNLGVSVRVDYLKRLAADARHDPEQRRALERYHCNRRVRSRGKPVVLDQWNACKDPLPDLTGRLCHAGLDLGWRDDLAALVYAFPLDGDRFALKCTAWMPEDCPHRDLSLEPWAGFIQSGELRVTPGEITDPESIYAEIRRARKLYRLQTLALDPNNARAVGVEVENALGVPAYWFGQSAKKYHEPLTLVLAAIREGRLVHGGSPLLTFAFANLTVKRDASDHMMPDKAHSEEKIDPAVAALMAFSECLYADRQPAGYGERGLSVV